MRALTWASLTILILFAGLSPVLLAQQVDGDVLRRDSTFDAHGVNGLSKEFLQRVLDEPRRRTGPASAEESLLASAMNVALEAGVVGQQNRFPRTSGSPKTRRVVCGSALIAAGVLTAYLATWHDSAAMAGGGVALTIGGIYVLAR